eukprot:CAMPEP_0197939344 /NCGR_PEP_ID=MMETSP1439-20131203/119543_1 /TAXON_ID=66791 /ORGANISM="Gonyaulax spinifera, Strain CCMP409" /LENGTH=48 /DNA_ID= /DNA_START= /DNA_END= /DNA_ORIENTATION=
MTRGTAGSTGALLVLTLPGLTRHPADEAAPEAGELATPSTAAAAAALL